MKLAEMKSLIKDYTPEQLRTIIAESYKLIPKARREDAGIDDIIRNPKLRKRRMPKEKNRPRPVEEIEQETNRFVEDARAQYYLMPNRYISKNKQSNWRFVVRRLFNELPAASKEEANASRGAALVEKLYTLLCDACGEVLFTGYDPFGSVRIPQTEFYHEVLALYERVLPKKEFVRKALLLIVDRELSRYTQYSNLMEEFITFLRIPDLKYLAIGQANELLETRRKSDAEGKRRDSSEYSRNEVHNNLCEFICRCYLRLDEQEHACEYFEEHYREEDPEVKLYVLVRILFSYQEKEEVVRAIKDAESRGVKLRHSLVELKKHIERHGAMPKFIG